MFPKNPLTKVELNENSKDDTTILYKHEGRLKKIFKITTQPDGSIHVHMPYHKEKSGYLYKFRMAYKNESTGFILKNNITQEFTSDTDVKLSLHRTGFVQFSKQSKIISGIDETGKIKGLGIRIPPLDNPIMSGPTFGVTFWGLDDFDDLNKMSNEKNYIVFEKNEFYEKYKGKGNALHIGAWIFPERAKKFIHKFGDKLFVMRGFQNFLPNPGQVFLLKVILINNNPSFIGLYSEDSMIENFSNSGYQINGPSQIVGIDSEGNKIGEHIHAVYPKPSSMVDGKNIPSIMIQRDYL